MRICSVLALSSILCGCGLFGARIEDERPPPVITQHKTLIAYECPPPPQVDTFDARNINWRVLSRKRLDAFMLELMVDLATVEDDDLFIINEAAGDFFFMPEEEVLWALNSDDYAALSANTADILAALSQMKKVAMHYQDCIQASKDIVAARNAAEEATVTGQ